MVLDKGPFVSFANCGLPYFVGDVIREEKDLVVASPELFKTRFNIDVRVHHEALSIDREAQTVEVKNLQTGEVNHEPYTHLVLSPGARAVRPPLEGIDLEGVFVLRTIPDSRRIKDWIDRKEARRAVVVGAGFVGLEMAENLARRGLEVTLLQNTDQVMAPLDPEMAVYLERRLKENGVKLVLGDGVAGFDSAGGEGLEVRTESGAALETDLVILSIGVQPRSELAGACGLELGGRGAVRVDASMRTSDPNIWAVGDAVEVTDVVTGSPMNLALAGPANRQGRLAADAMFGRSTIFRGVQATSVCEVFGLTVAQTGASEKTLRRNGRVAGEDYEVVYLHPGHHVGYFPGAKPIHIKLLFSKPDGRVLGAQALGDEGVARRIDAIAIAIQMGATVFDLEESELCYAPQFGAAKDPVNLAGMIAANALRGDHPVAHWRDLDVESVCLVDVRTPKEFENGYVPGAVNVPLDEMRGRLDDIPTDREVWVYCGVGQRAYNATRALMQSGHRVRNLSGGYQSYLAWRESKRGAG
ncbi:MAG: FAD-dependent oxidoreductase [Planctomycetota bacterium]